MHYLRIRFDAILDTPDHPIERVITIDNGLLVDDPGYQALTQCVILLPDGRINTEVLAITEGCTFGVPRHTFTSGSPINAQWIHDKTGAWLRLGKREIGHIANLEHQLLLQAFVTAVAGYLGWTLDWQGEAGEANA